MRYFRAWRAAGKNFEVFRQNEVFLDFARRRQQFLKFFDKMRYFKASSAAGENLRFLDKMRYFMSCAPQAKIFEVFLAK